MAAHGTPIDPGAANRAHGEKPQLKLGRYEVVRELGKGAMGIVYLAKDPLIGRLVALKTIRAAVHADDDETKEFQQRFIREAQAAGILNHPSIVTVHDIGQDEASAVSFIAMEYVEGHNLKEVLNQGRALTFEQIGDIIAQVAEALDFAHAKGIVHRDVKPANIILVDGTRAKITDFGIAKIASGAANLTTTGQFLGTPNYMAPEQVKGAPVDGRTDIFALGICLYECLTRRKPFGGDSLTSISYKIVHEPFPPLSEINPQIPEGFDEVVAHCLAKDPTKRYQRARDLGVALRAVIRGDKPSRPVEPLLADETMVTRERPQPTIEVPFPEAHEPSVVGAGTRPAAPQAAAAAAVAAAGASAAAAPTLERPKAPPAPPATPRPPREPIGKQLRTTLTNLRSPQVWKRTIAAPVFLAVVGVLVVALLAGVVAMRMRQPDVPVVDTASESLRARERQLRLEGEALMRQGKVTDAYAKYEELRRIAPNSPYVANLLQTLNAMRQQQERTQQQSGLAQTKYQEGMTLLSEKKYPDAIARFQEALLLNPNFADASTQLAAAQAEQQKLDAARLTRQQQRKSGQLTTTSTTAATDTVASTQTAAPAQPSQITTVFQHPFTDGRIIVRIGADIVANEVLYTERRRRVIGTVVREARPISVSHEFPSKNADVAVWVTVPQLKIQEHHNIPAVRFQAGQSHRLVVHYNPTSKTFSYELN